MLNYWAIFSARQEERRKSFETGFVDKVVLYYFESNVQYEF